MTILDCNSFYLNIQKAVEYEILMEIILDLKSMKNDYWIRSVSDMAPNFVRNKGFERFLLKEDENPV